MAGLYKLDLKGPSSRTEQFWLLLGLVSCPAPLETTISVDEDGLRLGITVNSEGFIKGPLLLPEDHKPTCEQPLGPEIRERRKREEKEEGRGKVKERGRDRFVKEERRGGRERKREERREGERERESERGREGEEGGERERERALRTVQSTRQHVQPVVLYLQPQS